MNEIAVILSNAIFRNNIVLVSFVGVLLIIVETPKYKDSFLKGLKFTAALGLSAYSGWIFTYYLFTQYQQLLPAIYFLNALLGIYLIRRMGLLSGEWLQGLPKSILAMTPMLALQLLVSNRMTIPTLDFFLILGSLVGFYLVFITIAALKEQLKLNEAKQLFKSEYVLILILAFLSAVIFAFELL